MDFFFLVHVPQPGINAFVLPMVVTSLKSTILYMTLCSSPQQAPKQLCFPMISGLKLILST